MLAPLLSVGKMPGRPPMQAKRRLIDGIRWRSRAGVPWRNAVLRAWQCVYRLYRR